ncbi:Proteasome subunit alpha type-1 [Stylophora pistillata]|uniref:Proteasome subunit alpha type n=1 Tax=Stylophora pistillata TaxID=50429 RepID=A0A2B4SQ00_STYPI|nr:Proteasome subunit alpha type-1 [Stylophora pistillata]
MFRNQYDNDVTVWSPQGRIHQIEYAMEAVKQGSATVGLKSKTHAVIVALKRAASELSAHQKKILPIDDHVAVSIAGLTADARLLSKFMRKMQIPTQRYGRRPYGVGLLVAGYDDMGPHIYQTCPSANYFDCKAMAIGARSQIDLQTYQGEPEDLIKHGLRALRETLPNEQELTTKNCSISVVGKDQDLMIYSDEGVAPYAVGDVAMEAESQAAGEGDAGDKQPEGESMEAEES